ncbi:hypothetical protein ACFL6U_09620, partial [Planctomycetota bacterium]
MVNLRHLVGLACIFSVFCMSVFGAKRNHIGQNQRVLVICVRYSNASTTRLTSAADWVTLLNNETRTFYSRATFNQTTFTFETATGVPGNGWFNLGYPNTDYDFD